jgi:disulfide oxidoreductase YuzD
LVPLAIFVEKAMDPITAAIVAALPALASGLVESTVKDAVKDAYEGLKALIRRKWGEASAVAKSVDALEANPNSKGEAAVLAENVAAVKATDDADVMQSLARLVDELKRAKIGERSAVEMTANVSGEAVVGVGVAQNVSIGSMNVGAPPKREER